MYVLIPQNIWIDKKIILQSPELSTHPLNHEDDSNTHIKKHCVISIFSCTGISLYLLSTLL